MIDLTAGYQSFTNRHKTPRSGFSRRKAVRTAQVRKKLVSGEHHSYSFRSCHYFKINAAQKACQPDDLSDAEIEESLSLAATVSTWRWTWLSVTGRCRTFSKFNKTFSSENKIRTRKTKSAKRQRHCAFQPIFSPQNLLSEAALWTISGPRSRFTP